MFIFTFTKRQLIAGASASCWAFDCDGKIYVVLIEFKGKPKKWDTSYAIWLNDLIAIGRFFISSSQPLSVCIHAVRTHFLYAITKNKWPIKLFTELTVCNEYEKNDFWPKLNLALISVVFAVFLIYVFCQHLKRIR